MVADNIVKLSRATMSRLVLHIGTHKTATTSIQKFLRFNSQALAERGVFYPDYTLVNKSTHYAHLGMVNGLSGRHRNFSREVAERFFKKVLERVSDYDTTIISAEPFYRHVDNSPNEDPYYEPNEYWPLRAGYINKVRDLFGDCEVVVVFRRQADYAQSLYQEHVKVTRYMGNFRQFLKDFWFHFAFAEQAEQWRSYFPKTRAISFDFLREADDTVLEFCRLLDLPIDDLEMPPRANEGMLMDLVILKRILHRTTIDKDLLRRRLEDLSTELPNELIDYMKKRSFFSSVKDMRSFQGQFDHENDRLRAFLAHDIYSNASVFSTEFNSDLNFGDRVKPPFLLELLELGLLGAGLESFHSGTSLGPS